MDDIDGTHPRKTKAISDFQRDQVMSNNSQLPFKTNVNNTRNKPGIFEHMTAPAVKQSELLKTAVFNGLPPPSHYARF